MSKNQIRPRPSQTLHSQTVPLDADQRHVAAFPSISAVGIDVARDKLDVQLMHSSEKNAKTSYKQFDNSPGGFAKLVRWVDQLNSQINSQTGQSRKPHYCMESTGAYSQALAQFLAEDGHLVSALLHQAPYFIKRYDEGSGMLNKNDRAEVGDHG